MNIINDPGPGLFTYWTIYRWKGVFEVYLELGIYFRGTLTIQIECPKLLLVHQIFENYHFRITNRYLTVASYLVLIEFKLNLGRIHKVWSSTGVTNGNTGHESILLVYEKCSFIYKTGIILKCSLPTWGHRFYAPNIWGARAISQSNVPEKTNSYIFPHTRC